MDSLAWNADSMGSKLLWNSFCTFETLTNSFIHRGSASSIEAWLLKTVLHFALLGQPGSMSLLVFPGPLLYIICTTDIGALCACMYIHVRICICMHGYNVVMNACMYY